MSAVASAREKYNQLMETTCGGLKPYLNSQMLETEHLRHKDKAVTQFKKKRKMGGEEFSAKYLAQLEKVKRDKLLFCWVLLDEIG